MKWLNTDKQNFTVDWFFLQNHHVKLQLLVLEKKWWQYNCSVSKSFPTYSNVITCKHIIWDSYLFDGESVWHHLNVALGLWGGQTLQGNRAVQGGALRGVHLSWPHASRAPHCALALQAHLSLDNHFGNFWFAETTNPKGSLQKLLGRNLKQQRQLVL